MFVAKKKGPVTYPSEAKPEIHEKIRDFGDPTSWNQATKPITWFVEPWFLFVEAKSLKQKAEMYEMLFLGNPMENKGLVEFQGKFI